MKRRLIMMILPACLALMVGAGSALADVTGQIDANIPFQFHIGNTTLPAGKYIFHMMNGTDLMIMTVRSADDKYAQEFMVRPSLASTVPNHSFVEFKRYGHEEFLKRLFEAGAPTGAAVDESSREESRQMKRGVKGISHTQPAHKE
jgi:hypothetical protein